MGGAATWSSRRGASGLKRSARSTVLVLDLMRLGSGVVVEVGVWCGVVGVGVRGWGSWWRHRGDSIDVDEADEEGVGSRVWAVWWENGVEFGGIGGVRVVWRRGVGMEEEEHHHHHIERRRSEEDEGVLAWFGSASKPKVVGSSWGHHSWTISLCFGWIWVG